MKITTKLMIVPILLVAFYAPYALAGDAVASMAKIVSSLQHFPNDTDKAALRVIAESHDNASVQAVARAIAGISHKVGGADKTALQAIADNTAESAALRQLATIVVGINHMPNAEAKTALAMLMGD